MAGIGEWLTGLGLERYAPAFEEAEIDLSTLVLLSDADLAELGIPLGPRRKILAQLAEAGGANAAEPGGERRQITVLFADLVGSTALSTRVDPEEMGELLDAYKAAVADEVTAAGGTVAKYLGDGILAYFGWPQAREDAAERAIHCAFKVRERIKRIHDPDGNGLQTRIGIATGLVVVGGQKGAGNAREDAVAGEVLNLAARLQSLAEPDQICVSDRTRELAGGLFEWASAGAHALKGFSEDVSAWHPLGEATQANRFAAKRMARRSLVGRDLEIQSLVGQWDRVVEGDGRAALIFGEPGIGKSRLLEELCNRTMGQPSQRISWQCSALHQSKPLYPVIEWISRSAGLVDGEDVSGRLAKLTAVVAAAGLPSDDVVPLFAELLAIPAEAGYAPSSLSPVQRRAATIAALGDWIRPSPGSPPTLLNLEDAHWADPTTLELITLLIHGMAGAPLMIAVTGRPEFSAPWIGRAKVSVMGLDRLSDRECEGLLREIIADGSVSPGAVKHVLDHSDGNPLFVEELSAAIVQAGRQGGDGVPDTLQDSLMARLDQLGDAKRTAQFCSVLGRHFARPLLAHLFDGIPALLDTNISTLIAHDIIHPLGGASERRYQFKHALVRDAAYHSLLRTERRRLHEQCGQLLETHFPAVCESEPELLAYHFGSAGLAGEAAAYHERAGDRATAGAAYVEAITSYREALAQLAQLTDESARDRRELAILLKLGPALTIIDGPQVASVRETYEQGQERGRRTGDMDGLFKAMWGLWYNANVGRDYDRAKDFADELVKLSEQTGDDTHVLEALHCRWSSGMFRGDCLQTIPDAERGVGLYQEERHHRLAASFGGHDPGVCAHGVAASSQVTTGSFDAALNHSREALRLAARLDHPHSIAHGLMTALSVTATAAKYDDLRIWATELGELAAAYNFPPQRPVAAFFLRWVDAKTGNLDWDTLGAAFDAVFAIGPLTPIYVSLYAEELLTGGKADEALRVVDRFVEALKFPFGFYLPEVYRVRGQALAALGRHAEGVGQLRLALRLAEEQGSHLFAMRTALALAAIDSSREHIGAGDAAAALDRALAAIGPSDWPELQAARRYRPLGASAAG